MKTLVLFDFNGTIINDYFILYSFYRHIAWHSRKDYQLLDVGDFFENLATRGYEYISEEIGFNNKKEFEERYIKFYKAHIKKPDLFQGMLYTLHYLQGKKDTNLGLITLQHKFLTKPLLKDKDIKDLFSFIKYRSQNKAKDIELAIKEAKDKKVDPDYTIYIGDMPSDVIASKQAGVISATFINGYIRKNVFDKQEETKPDKFIYHPKELINFVEKFH